MNPLSMGAESLRIVVTLLIPGLVGLWPFFLIAVHHFHDPSKPLDIDGAVAVGLVLAGLATGMVLENFGSRIESDVIDKWWEKKRYPDFYDQWYRYLLLPADVQRVAFRYASTLAMRMKFELGMACAMILAATASPFAVGGCTTNLGEWLIFLGHWTAAAIFIFEAFESGELLAQLRARMTALKME